MTSLTAPYLYTEARINIEPTFPGATLHIHTGSSSFFSPRKRQRLENDQEQDEDAYSKKYLATESSIFFRRKERTPRSFLWRVLNDRQTLELQCVDLVQERATKQESLLTYSLSLPNPIRPNGIAFADPEDTDSLHIFVLTTSNELFTFTLKKDLLLRSTVPSSSDFDSASCYKSFSPSSFSFRYPHKLVSISSLELIISLHDGGLLRLTRKAGDNGANWRETFFSEGGWGSSLRGLIPWKGHNTVRYGNVDLEPATAAAIESSPDREHVFTISLDHSLKAWNAQTGKVGVQIDILGEPRREPNAGAQYLINPSQGTLMKVFHVSGQPDGDLYYIVTSSPKDRQFKFWAVRDADSAAYGIRDVQPSIKLIPPLDELMDTNAWQLADFDLKPGQGWRDTQLWVRARSGAVHRNFTLSFDLLSSHDDLEDAWRNKWVVVEEGSLSIERIVGQADFPRELSGDQSSVQSPSISDQWIDFLCFPGRFSSTMLETALYIYRKGRNQLTLSKPSESSKPLKERLAYAIASKVTLRHTTDGRPDYTQYISDISGQWTVFFGLVRHLHQRRSDSLSLALDPDSGLCWSIRADLIAPIRLCSELEIHRFNEEMFSTQDEGWILNSLPLADHLPDESSIHVARLLAAARSFRGHLSSAFNQKFTESSSVLALRVNDESTADPPESFLQELYTTCEFPSEVSDDEFNRLTDMMQDLGGLGELENDVFVAALDRLTEASRGNKGSHVLARYGDKTTIRGSQDALAVGRDILLDLLSLLVFISQDLEPDELAAGFDPAELYALIITKLREYNVLNWLAGKVRQESSKKRRDSVNNASQSPQPLTQPTLTLAESIFIGDWQDMKSPDESMPALITYWSRAWTFGPNVSAAYDGITAYIMANLLKHEDYRLAVDFDKYLPHNAWTTYLRGRLQLADGEYTYAAQYFTQSSHDLSAKGKVSSKDFDTASLLLPQQRDSFANGLPRFFLHVSSLFEDVRLLSHAADFSALALHHLEAESKSDFNSSIADLDKRKRSMQGSPASTKVDLAMEEIRLLRISELKEDILSRLLNSALQSGRFETAFDALTKFSNPAL